MECFGQVTFLCKPYAQNPTFLHVMDNPPIQINPPKIFPYVLRLCIKTYHDGARQLRHAALAAARPKLRRAVPRRREPTHDHNMHSPFNTRTGDCDVYLLAVLEGISNSVEIVTKARSNTHACHNNTLEARRFHGNLKTPHEPKSVLIFFVNQVVTCSVCTNAAKKL